ncbi:MAG: hypothetical protein KF881_05100 [Acidobacteria bacterium]|nr:hypothetical protein [Acidobacteriota bacterium]
MRKKVELTQKALISKLHRLGYRDIKERRINDWKSKGLLPHFDRRGVGLGKSKGRSESAWTDGRAIVERAVWVYRLLEIYGYSESVYLPLWMLGHDVHHELVRTALLEPLEGVATMFEVEAVGKLERVEPYERKDGIIEDYIGDISHDWIKKEKFVDLLGVPQEVVEATMNIFFNPDYDLEDLGFEDGNKQLAVWKDRVNNEIVPVLTRGFDENPESVVEPIRPDGLDILFSQPGFFQKYLSVDALQRVVAEASDEDFRNVQGDLCVVRTAVEPLGDMIVTLMKHAKVERLPTLSDVLPQILQAATLFVMADISLRRHGHGPLIDHVKAEAAKKFHEDMSQVTEQALAEVGPEFANAFKKGLKKLRRNWNALISERSQIALVS